MRLKLLAVVVAGVCLLLASPAVQGADKEEESYAKVELKGTFREGRSGPIVVVRMDSYQLDFSRMPTKPDRDALKKLEEKTVIVKGTLETRPGWHIVIIVSSIRDADLM